MFTRITDDDAYRTMRQQMRDDARRLREGGTIARLEARILMALYGPLTWLTQPWRYDGDRATFAAFLFAAAAVGFTVGSVVA